MKHKIAIGLVMAGLCVHSYADLIVVGKNQANNLPQIDADIANKPVKSKATNSTVSKKCNEVAKLANKAITARLNGERVHGIQGEVNDMYHNSSSPVKNDRTFNFMAHKVVLSAYSEQNLPPANDRKAQSTFKNKFSQNQRAICIDYLNKTALG